MLHHLPHGCRKGNVKRNPLISGQTTYAKARANLGKLCHQVVANCEVVIIKRRGSEDVALVAASELSSLIETVHLLRSPKNAQRLLSALNRAKKRTT